MRNLENHLTGPDNFFATTGEAMSLRICPECAKAFFMSLLDSHARCPHCGVFLADRRNAKRERKVCPLTFSVRGSVLRAKTTDLSGRGAGIIFAGRNLEKGTVIDVTISELMIRRPARMVWAKQGSGSLISAGIELL